MNNDLKKAVEILKNGGIVIFPTDTAFGIGCRIDDEGAVSRLFKIRKRSETKATPVLVSSLEMAKECWEYVPYLVVQKLIKPHWPGALTIVLPCKTEKVPSKVRGGGETLGLRMPNNIITLDIIKGLGLPIIGTSANFAGDLTPYEFEDLNSELVKQVDYVLRDSGQARMTGSNKELVLNKASTVIDCSVNPWKILRQGAVNPKF